MQNYGDASDRTTSMDVLKDRATGTIEDLQGKAQDLKDRVADSGRKATDKIDAQREPAASALEAAADSLRQRGGDGRGIAARAARTTADKIQATADYVRSNDVRAMADDLQQVVRRHPGAAIATAVLAGFLLGRAFTSRD